GTSAGAISGAVAAASEVERNDRRFIGWAMVLVGHCSQRPGHFGACSPYDGFESNSPSNYADRFTRAVIGATCVLAQRSAKSVESAVNWIELDRGRATCPKSRV